MHKWFPNNSIKAFGLVEVLLGLAIFGTAIIMATSITVRSLRIVKDNEIADNANAFMVKTLEYSKSLALTENNSKFTLNSTTTNYFITYSNSDEITNISDLNLEKVTFNLLTGQDWISNENCDIGNNNGTSFRVTTAIAELNNSPLCNQLQFTKVGANYQVISRVYYKTAKGWFTSEMRGFLVVSQ
ncbi:MAG: hypothetical protein WCJ58_01840 [bacterium]